MSIETLKTLYEEQREIEKRLEAELHRVYPVGATIYFEHGRGKITAEIISASYWTERIKVRNISSAKEYWININSYQLPQVVDNTLVSTFSKPEAVGS